MRSSHTALSMNILPRSHWASFGDGWMQATPDDSGKRTKYGLHSVVESATRKTYVCCYEPQTEEGYSTLMGEFPQYDVEISAKAMRLRDDASAEFCILIGFQSPSRLLYVRCDAVRRVWYLILRSDGQEDVLRSLMLDSIRPNTFYDLLIQVRGDSISLDVNTVPIFTAIRIPDGRPLTGLVGVVAVDSKFAFKQWRFRSAGKPARPSLSVRSFDGRVGAPSSTHYPAAARLWPASASSTAAPQYLGPAAAERDRSYTRQDIPDPSTSGSYLTGYGTPLQSSFHGGARRQDASRAGAWPSSEQVPPASPKPPSSSGPKSLAELMMQNSGSSTLAREESSRASIRAERVSDVPCQHLHTDRGAAAPDSSGWRRPSVRQAEVSSSGSQGVDFPRSYSTALSPSGSLDHVRQKMSYLSMRGSPGEQDEPSYVEGTGGLGQPGAEEESYISQSDQGRMKEVAHRLYDRHDRHVVDTVLRDVIQRDLGVTFDDIAAVPDAKRLLHEAVILPMIMPEFFTGIREPWKVFGSD